MLLFWIGFLCGTVVTAYLYPTIHTFLKAHHWV